MPIEDDLRTSLRRAAGSAEPSPYAWGRMQDRAERPTSSAPRGRIGAGVLAIVIALAAITFVVQAFGGMDDNGVLDPVPIHPATLEGTEWILEQLAAEEMTSGPALTLRFDEGGFSAESECNTNMGRYEVRGATLVTSGGVQTTAGCEGAAAERQRIVFDVIRSSPTIELGGATLTLTSDAGTLRYVRHPCSFLTDAQVATATGDEVSNSGLVPPVRIPGGTRLCSYEVPGRYASVVLHVVPTSLEEFHALRDRDPESNITIPVEGIGDEAFVQGMASISVFLGDHYLGIGLQHGAGTPGVRQVLEDLARAAIGQAEASSVEPIPDDALGIQVERSADAVSVVSVVVSFGDERIGAQGIDTPGDELAYPSRGLGAPLPTGTPIVVRSVGEDVNVRVRRLVDAGPGELVERSARRLPEELVELDEPGETAISVHYAYPDGVGEVGFTVQVEAPEPAAVDGLADVPQGWTELSTPPEVRSWNSAKVWTGSELLTWGGYVYTGFSDEVARDDGFAWEPISGATRELAPSPLSARVHAAFAWTGRELLVWGGRPEKAFGGPYADGAAYDPAADRWRSMASAPITARVPQWHVWTGRELLVWGDQDDAAVTDGAAYDPATDAWRPIAASPQGTWREAVWTGSEVIVFAGPMPPRQEGSAQAAAYDPASDSWTDPVTIPLGSVATSAWDGQGVVAWSFSHRIARLDPSTSTWTRLPSAPLQESNYWPEAVGGPGFVFGVQAGEAVVLDVRSQRWRVATQDELLLWDMHQIVEGGDVVITLRREPGTGMSRAFAYRPFAR